MDELSRLLDMRLTKEQMKGVLKLIRRLLANQPDLNLITSFYQLMSLQGVQHANEYEVHVCNAGKDNKANNKYCPGFAYPKIRRSEWLAHQNDKCDYCETPRFHVNQKKGPAWREMQPKLPEVVATSPNTAHFMSGVDWMTMGKNGTWSVGVILLRLLDVPAEVCGKRACSSVLAVINGGKHQSHLTGYMKAICQEVSKHIEGPGDLGVIVEPHPGPSVDGVAPPRVEPVRIHGVPVVSIADTPATATLTRGMGHSALKMCHNCNISKPPNPPTEKAPLGYDSPTLQTLPGSNREEYVLIYDVRMKFTHEQIMDRGAPFIHGWSQGDPRVVGCHAQPLLPLLLQYLDARLAHLVPVYQGSTPRTGPVLLTHFDEGPRNWAEGPVRGPVIAGGKPGKKVRQTPSDQRQMTIQMALGGYHRIVDIFDVDISAFSGGCNERGTPQAHCSTCLEHKPNSSLFAKASGGGGAVTCEAELAQHAKSKAHSEAIGMAQRAGGGASSIKAAAKAATTTVVQGTYRRMVLAALFMVFFMYGLLKHQLEWFMSADGHHIDVRREIVKRGAALQSPSDLGRDLGDLANRTEAISMYGWRMEDYKHWYVHFSPIVLRGNLLPEPYRGLWTALEGACLHYLTPGSENSATPEGMAAGYAHLKTYAARLERCRRDPLLPAAHGDNKDKLSVPTDQVCPNLHTTACRLYMQESNVGRTYLFGELWIERDLHDLKSITTSGIPGAQLDAHIAMRVAGHNAEPEAQQDYKARLKDELTQDGQQALLLGAGSAECPLQNSPGAMMWGCMKAVQDLQKSDEATPWRPWHVKQVFGEALNAREEEEEAKEAPRVAAPPYPVRYYQRADCNGTIVFSSVYKRPSTRNNTWVSIPFRLDDDNGIGGPQQHRSAKRGVEQAAAEAASTGGTRKSQRLAAGASQRQADPLPPVEDRPQQSAMGSMHQGYGDQHWYMFDATKIFTVFVTSFEDGEGYGRMFFVPAHSLSRS
ncbi:hypothetical protein QJQ45_001626 [Haematococcus lacustris]|nr:hypothetical protein QJQ45_001626 [Haematococcus lacustris]